jgi:hypothetical protein
MEVSSLKVVPPSRSTRQIAPEPGKTKPLRVSGLSRLFVLRMFHHHREIEPWR